MELNYRHIRICLSFAAFIVIYVLLINVQFSFFGGDNLQLLSFYGFGPSLPDISQKPRPRVVITLTTIPIRLPFLKPTLDSLLANQSIKPDVIQINIPYFFSRTNRSYEDVGLSKLSFLHQPRIRIHRCKDYGPATKLLPTLLLEKDPETLLIVVDDDTVYPRNLVQVMSDLALYNNELATKDAATQDATSADQKPSYIFVAHPGDVLLAKPPRHQRKAVSSMHTVQGLPGYSKCCVKMFEAFGSIGYRRKLFDPLPIPASALAAASLRSSKQAALASSAAVNHQYSMQPTTANSWPTFWEYMNIALANPYCYRSDDLVFSNYFALYEIAGLDISSAISVWQLPVGFMSGPEGALHKLDEKVKHPYAYCADYLKTLGWQRLKFPGNN